MTKKKLVDLIIGKLDEKNVDIVEARQVLEFSNPKNVEEAVNVIEHYFGRTHAHLAGSVDGCLLCKLMRDQIFKGHAPLPVFKGAKDIARLMGD